MKTLRLLPFVFAAAGLTSCNIEYLVTETNTKLEGLNAKNDSLNSRIAQIEGKVDTIARYNNIPGISNRKRVTFNDFYYGNVIGEEITERLGKWNKIKVTEKIELQGGGYFLKERTGWYSFSEPEYVYLVTDDAAAAGNSSAANQIDTADITIVENPNALEDFPGFDKKTTAKTAAKAAAMAMAASGKTDNLSQKEADILLASSFQNFDGLRFTGKRFDYINLTLGSYRGTYFDDCNLDNAFGKRTSYSNNFDFDNTVITRGSNKNMSFAFWKFNNTAFTNTTIEDATFTDCTFSTDAAGLANFNNVQIRKSVFVNNGIGYIKNQALFFCNLELVRFTNADLHSCGFYGTNLINCSVFGGKWKGVSFNSYPSNYQNTIQGGIFKDLYIYSGAYQFINIGPLGLVKPQFQNVEFAVTNFSRSAIDAWFSENCKVTGSSNFSGTDFKGSIFDGITFGDQSQISTVNMQGCNFSNCEFRSETKFIKCNLTGATFPADLTNVTFINCTGAPQN